MLSKIGQICRENVKLCHDVEYILIDDFFDPVLFDKSHTQFLSDYFIVDNTLSDVLSLSSHPLMEMLQQYNNEILNAVNTIWQEICVENKSSVALMPAGNTLQLHSDTHWETIPVRGVLYLNDVCGTTFHSDCCGNNPVELGGKPNQLLLFKVSEHSYHSVGLYNTEPKDRFAIQMMFDRINS